MSEFLREHPLLQHAFFHSSESLKVVETVDK